MNAIDSKLLRGKTILRIDSTATNCWTWYFTDGSQAVIDTECKLACGAGQIYGPTIIELTEPKRPKIKGNRK